MADEFVLLTSSDGDCAKIFFHGATVTSWKCQDTEMLFVSKKAVYDNKKAIRGGVPVVFPNFGPWQAGPQHGFARISRWTLDGEPKIGNDLAEAAFILEDSDTTRSMWDYKFKFRYTVTVGQRKLRTHLAIENKDNKPFDFTTLLHTYFRVPDVTKTKVTGFKGLQYKDKVKQGQFFIESKDEVTISSETDRVYASTPNDHKIVNCAGGHSLVVQKDNMPDTVVWNPWIEKSKTMSDFDDNEYPYMICVEAGYVNKPFTLQPGEVFQCCQTCESKQL